MVEEHLSWHRPGDAPGQSGHGEQDSGYTGPPPTLPPPRSWRPPVIHVPAPPRALPGQDVTELEAQERDARTVTYGVAMVAAAIGVILLFALCARVLF